MEKDYLDPLQIDVAASEHFPGEAQLSGIQDEIQAAHALILERTGRGNDFLGWVDLPVRTGEPLISRIEADAARIRQMAEVFVVIGIGGSYLGARAVIDALSGPFQPMLPVKGCPQVIYAGENLSEDYHAALLELLDRKEYAVAVISKSGTTTEPAVAFRLVRRHAEARYGKEEASRRIFAITDASRGALKKLADSEGYSTYVIPDDVGGRYSVLTPVGLLPVAVAGFDIRALLDGAGRMRERALAAPLVTTNPCARYAALRNLLLRQGKTVELLVSYEPGLQYMTEWWKQLFGESEGKENKGIFPAGVIFTTDLHSMGQYIQEGMRSLFETVISVMHPGKHLQVPEDPDDSDGLNFLSGLPLTEVNHQAETATTLAHTDGGVPNLRITIPSVSEFSLGELIYFFEFTCALSGYVLGVNPFDQPGVEAYKKNMFALLGKPGFEKESEAIRKRMEG